MCALLIATCYDMTMFSVNMTHFNGRCINGTAHTKLDGTVNKLCYVWRGFWSKTAHFPVNSNHICFSIDLNLCYFFSSIESSEKQRKCTILLNGSNQMADEFPFVWCNSLKRKRHSHRLKWFLRNKALTCMKWTHKHIHCTSGVFCYAIFFFLTLRNIPLLFWLSSHKHSRFAIRTFLLARLLFGLLLATCDRKPKCKIHARTIESVAKQTRWIHNFAHSH